MPSPMSPEQAFELIERRINSTGRLLTPDAAHSLRQMLDEGIKQAEAEDRGHDVPDAMADFAAALADEVRPQRRAVLAGVGDEAVDDEPETPVELSKAEINDVIDGLCPIWPICT